MKMEKNQKNDQQGTVTKTDSKLNGTNQNQGTQNTDSSKKTNTQENNKTDSSKKTPTANGQTDGTQTGKTDTTKKETGVTNKNETDKNNSSKTTPKFGEDTDDTTEPVNKKEREDNDHQHDYKTPVGELNGQKNNLTTDKDQKQVGKDNQQLETADNDLNGNSKR